MYRSCTSLLHVVCTHHSDEASQLLHVAYTHHSDEASQFASGANLGSDDNALRGTWVAFAAAAAFMPR